jgi:hypothetical protein
MKRTMTKAVKLGALLFAVAMIQAPARANTYLFTISASDLLLGESGNNDGLANAYGQTTTVFDESAYFAIFLQPSNTQISSYAYVSETAPNSGSDSWEATTIDDPSSPDLGYGPGQSSYATTNCNGADCTWAQFSKQPGQSGVTIFSDADNNGAGNIFVNHTYSDAESAPYGWGTTTATISTAYSANCSTTLASSPACTPYSSQPTLTFEISTTQTLSGPIELLGYASDLESTDSGSFPAFGPKEYDGIPFTLEVTPSLLVAPEPGSWAFVLAGCLFLLLARWGRRKKWTANPSADRS